MVGPECRSRALPNMKRLLRACNELAGRVNKEAERRRLATYVSILERYWHEVDAAQICSEETMQEYWCVHARNYVRLSVAACDDLLEFASVGRHAVSCCCSC
eukprot:6183763-Pleurochrysis_carterae.AAC.3